MSNKVYEIVTERLINQIENGVIPWRQQWSTGIALSKHRNGSSLNFYQGINAFTTALSGFSSPHWYSAKQANELGGSIRQGEKGLPIVYFNFLERENEKKNDIERIPFARYSLVFNFDQIDGLPESISGRIAAKEQISNDAKIERCERVTLDYLNRPSISFDSNKTFYRPKTDSVHMPEKKYFESIEDFYQVLFHELAHSTGHDSRLKRQGVVNPSYFGNHEYSKEELIAEMTSAFLCSETQIDQKTESNSAAYLSSWLKVLKADPKMLVQSASHAQKAANYILNKGK